MRVELLGVPVDLVDEDALGRAVVESVAAHRRLMVGYLNLHAAHLYHRDPELRAFMAAADLIHLDGMPLVLWGRALGLPLRRRHRVTWVDWLPVLLDLADRHAWRVHFLASTEAALAELEPLMAKRWPRVALSTHSGHFDVTPGSAACERVLEDIARRDPEVLLIGMGQPRQEAFALRHRERLGPRVVFCMGAAVDYLVGAVPTPPRWAGRVGLEWAFRLAHEPRRLGHRYLVEPFSLVRPALTDVRNRRRH